MKTSTNCTDTTNNNGKYIYKISGKKHWKIVANSAYVNTL